MRIVSSAAEKLIFLKHLRGFTNQPTEKTVSGGTVHIEDALAGKVIELSAYINAKQAGSGTPSLDNVRAISGVRTINIFVGASEESLEKTSIVIPNSIDTIYGGYINVTTGNITITHYCINLENMVWTPQGSNPKNMVSASLIGTSSQHTTDAPDAATTGSQVLCEKYQGIPSKAGGYGTAGQISLNTNQRIYLATFDGEEPSGKLVYEIKTPITASISPTTIRLLLNENYVKCSTGDIKSLKYLAHGGS